MKKLGPYTMASRSYGRCKADRQNLVVKGFLKFDNMTSNVYILVLIDF